MARDNASMPMMPDGGTDEMMRLQGASPEQQIRDRAFALYQQRVAHGIEGDADGDWLTAEREHRAPPPPRDPGTS